MRAIRLLLPTPRSARGKLGIVAFLTTFSVLAGSTAGYAYWQSSLTVTSTVGAADLTLATSNFNSVGYTFGNDSLVTTGSVTATNSTVTSSTQAGTVSLTFSPAAAAPLAGLVLLQLWTTTNPATCTAASTVPFGATVALWAANTVVTTTLAPGASVSYCVRSSIASRESVATSGGSSTFSPEISGTITVGNFSGTAVATTTQSTQYVFPAFLVDTTHWNFIRPNVDNATYNYCLDVSGTATTSGTMALSYSCETSSVSNQQWKFTASGVAGYYTIQPRNATALRVDNNSSSTSGAGVNVVTAGAAATATNQQWQLQQVSAGVFEVVSAYSGMCLTSPAGSSINLGQVTQAPCNGSAYQQFRLSQAFENVACSENNSAWTFTWTSISTGPYHVQVQGTTTDIAVTSSSTASGISISTSGYGRNSTTNVNFIDGLGTLVGTGALTAGSGNGNGNNGNGGGNSGGSCTVSDLQ